MRTIYFATLCLICCVSAAVYLFFYSTSDSRIHSVTTVGKVDMNTMHLAKIQSSTQSSATLEAVGDVLMHKRVYEKAKTKDGYDFKPFLEKVEPYLQQSDITIANSESIIGGSQIGLSTYPSFNSPYAVGNALKDDGVDVVTMANNHTLDRGIPAIRSAIHHWNQIGMVHIGSYLSNKDREKIRTVSKNGITFSFLAYTYGTNGIPTPKGKDYLVNRINLPQMKKDIQKAKKVSDVVVVFLHFGIQYEREPDKDQKQLVQQLADQGVDIVLACHPHVLQPVQWVKGKGDHRTFVAYSLGNFFTGQDDSLYKEVGGILKLKVVKTTKNDQSTFKVTEPEFMPTWVNPKNYNVVPLYEAGKDGLANEPAVYKEMKKHMQQWMPELKYESTLKSEKNP